MQQAYDFGGDDRRAGDRRSQRTHVFRDKRSGFDRRGSAQGGGVAAILQNALLGLRARPGVLWTLLAAVNVLNVADFTLTLNVLGAGGGEANPLMRSLFALSPVWAGVFKVLAVLLASLLVWRFKRYRAALLTALVMVAVFAGVLLYHICGLVFFD
jgi:hypothetical protein